MRRPTASLAALIAAGFLLAGCATGPSGGAPSSTSAPAPGESAPGDPIDMDPGAAWLDGGRAIAVVTWGSSTCVPVASEVTAEGQAVHVVLTDAEGDDAICTADLAPRASVATLPEGVDPTEDVELAVTYGDDAFDARLAGDDAFAEAAGTPSDFQPSAGWFRDGSLVLQTWGSSSCRPVVESAVADGATGTIAFAEPDAEQVCTMDMAPRTTVVGFEGEADRDGFTLTLTGGGIEATIPVAA